VVSAALPFHRGDADFLHRFAVLRRCRAHAQALRRVSAGRGAVHAVCHRHHGVLGDPVARAFLVRHSRSGRPADGRRHHPLLERGREEQSTSPLGFFRLCAGSLSLQPIAVDGHRSSRARLGLGAVSHVGGGARGPLAKQTRRQGASTGGGGGAAPTVMGGRTAAARTPALRRAHYVPAVSIVDPPAHPHRHERSALLGHRRTADRICRQQRLLRRTGGRRERVAGHLPDAAGGGRIGDTVLRHRRRPVRRGTDLARARHAFRRNPRCLAAVRIDRLAVQIHRHRGHRNHPARHHHAGRHDDADHRRLPPLRSAAIPRGTLPDHIAADAGIRLVRHVRADHGAEQVHRPRHRHRDIRTATHPFRLRVGEHAVPSRRRSGLHVFGHERLRSFRAGAVLGHYLLVRHLCISRRGLHRVQPARGRGVLAAAQPSRAAARAASRARGGPVLAARRGVRRLVLLQLARTQRVFDGGRSPPSARRLRAAIQEVREPPAAENNRGGGGHQYLSRTPFLRRHGALHPTEQGRAADFADSSDRYA
jgi:hypothetical protein